MEQNECMKMIEEAQSLDKFGMSVSRDGKGKPYIMLCCGYGKRQVSDYVKKLYADGGRIEKLMI